MIENSLLNEILCVGCNKPLKLAKFTRNNDGYARRCYRPAVKNASLIINKTKLFMMVFLAINCISFE